MYVVVITTMYLLEYIIIVGELSNVAFNFSPYSFLIL